MLILHQTDCEVLSRYVYNEGRISGSIGAPVDIFLGVSPKCSGFSLRDLSLL